MKFSEKFKDIRQLGILKGKNPVPCAICGELTLFIDLYSEAPFCSEECLEEFYRQYWEAEEKYDNSDSPW